MNFWSAKNKCGHTTNMGQKKTAMSYLLRKDTYINEIKLKRHNGMTWNPVSLQECRALKNLFPPSFKISKSLVVFPNTKLSYVKLIRKCLHLHPNQVLYLTRLLQSGHGTLKSYLTPWKDSLIKASNTSWTKNKIFSGRGPCTLTIISASLK